MGIARLATYIKPYATPYKPEAADSTRKAVIDGPALAYHAYELTARGISEKDEVSYNAVNITAINFLRELTEHNIQIGKVYFDGALPELKREERLERLKFALTALRKYGDNGVSLRRALGGGSLPFLVPSVFEAIRASEFGSSTTIVPGEADQWCASYAYTHHQSIIFTGDTDLLVYEPGPGSLVVMFQDLLGNSKYLKIYDPGQIASRLDLGRNLQPLAYAIYFHPKAKTLGHHISYAKQLLLETVYMERYAAWKDSYTQKTVADAIESSHAVTKGIVTDTVLQSLDPRISELIIQVLRLFPFLDNCQPTLEIYLPFLIESPEASSAWNRAPNIRLLGYSLLIPDRAAAITVREFVRKSYDISGNKVVPYSQILAVEESKSLKASLEAWVQHHGSLFPAQKWRLFAARTVMDHMTESQALSITFDKIWRAVEGEVHWDPIYVQYKASMDAVLYSLRILIQCISIFQNFKLERVVDIELSNIVHQLLLTLGDFPGIGEIFPTSQPRHSISPDNPLSQAIIRMGVAMDEPLGGFETSKGKKKRKPKSTKRISPYTLPAKSANAFALLGLGGMSGSED